MSFVAHTAGWRAFGQRVAVPTQDFEALEIGGDHARRRVLSAISRFGRAERNNVTQSRGGVTPSFSWFQAGSLLCSGS
jgi:hypothetical protein